MKGNARNETEFDPICINRQTLETGNSVKLLGTVRPFVYYVPVGGGGFQKSVVYQNFTLLRSSTIGGSVEAREVSWERTKKK